MPVKAKSSRRTTKKAKTVGTNISGVFKKKTRPSLPAEIMRAQNVLDMWCQYEGYRRSGKFNMITDGAEVAKLMDVDLRTYTLLQDRYGELKNIALRLTLIGDLIYGK